MIEVVPVEECLRQGYHRDILHKLAWYKGRLIGDICQNADGFRFNLYELYNNDYKVATVMPWDVLEVETIPHGGEIYEKAHVALYNIKPEDIKEAYVELRKFERM